MLVIVVSLPIHSSPAQKLVDVFCCFTFVIAREGFILFSLFDAMLFSQGRTFSSGFLLDF